MKTFDPNSNALTALQAVAIGTLDGNKHNMDALTDDTLSVLAGVLQPGHAAVSREDLLAVCAGGFGAFVVAPPYQLMLAESEAAVDARFAS